MSPGGSRIIRTIYDMLPGLDMYGTDPAQHVLLAGYNLRQIIIDRDLSEVSKTIRYVDTNNSAWD